MGCSNSKPILAVEFVELFVASDDGKPEATTTFEPRQSRIDLRAKLSGPYKEPVKLVWTAIDTDGAVQPNKEIFSLSASATDMTITSYAQQEGSWPEGQYKVEVFETTATEPAYSVAFTIKATGPVQVLDVRFFTANPDGSIENVVTSFPSSTRQLNAIADLDRMLTKGMVNIKWIAADTNGVAPANYVISTVDVEADAVGNSIRTNAQMQRDWPVGKYRMEMLYDGQPLVTKDFDIVA